MRKSGKKLLGIMLAASMVISAAFPMQGTAAGNGREYLDTENGWAAAEDGQQPSGYAEEESGKGGQPGTEEGRQQPSGHAEEESGGGGQPEAEKGGQQPSGHAEESSKNGQPGTVGEGQQLTGEGQFPDSPEDGQQPEGQQLTGEGQFPDSPEDRQQPEGKEPDKEQEIQPSQEESPEGDAQPAKEPKSQQEGTQPSEGQSQTPENEQAGKEEVLSGSAEQQAFLLPQTDGNIIEGSYDINQPVIERFELEEQGQALTMEDTLHFNMYVYDSDSNIKSVSAELCSFSGGYQALKFQPGNEEKLYTVEVPCSQLRAGRYYVSSICVEDERDNYVNGIVTGENGEYLYQFTVQDKEVVENVTISDLKMEKKASNSDGTLKSGDSVTYTANVQCEGGEISSGYMYVTYQDSVFNRIGFNVTYDKDTGSISGTFIVGEKTYPEEWVLYDIYLYTESGHHFNFSPSGIASEEELKFTVSQKYDNTPPVIEKIDIGGTGREVRAGDTIEIKVTVQEDHPNDTAGIYFTPEDTGAANELYVPLKYQIDTGQYTGEIPITDCSYPGKWQLSFIRIYDTYSNGAFLGDFKGDEEGKDKHYIVLPEGYDKEKPAIQDISLAPSGQPVGVWDRVTLKVVAEEKNPKNGTARFEWKGAEYPVSKYIDLSYNQTQKAYIGTVLIETSTSPGQWELAELSICDKNNNTTNLSEFEGLEEKGPWIYTVDEAGYDVNGPLIQSINIEKNGQFVRPGETLGVRIKVKEKNPSYEGKAYFYPQVTNVSSFVCVDLRYNPAEQEYVGSISITDDTYPCEWALTGLEIKDTLGHGYSLSEELPSWYSSPWYYKVKSGNTYREDVKNVTFHIYGLMEQEDGSYQFGYSDQTAENVGRRAALKELGILPKLAEGITATWYCNWIGVNAGDDTELLFRDTNDMQCSLSAVYDKGCANVRLTYVSKENGEQTVIIPVFVEKEATYKDVLEALELPEDAKADDFAEFLLSYSDSSHNWDTVVGEVANISAIADYRTCQTTWNARYIGQDGKEASKVITKSYQEGTTVADALAELDPPEDAIGMEGESWLLLGADGSQVLSKEMVSFDIVALYHGRTTLDVTYTYRGEDGKITSGSKLLAIEGENLSDATIQGEATDAFKDAVHLPGLMLSEWAGTMDDEQGNYKKLQFQALYYNCVVVLKYPDETCQYLVVEKNAAFILPTENDAYTDILWEGFTQGQAVTITEDREFLAADAKRKDGTEEIPEGERLTEEEIAKIKEEIEKAEAGASVRIDMKKATVVPKEVLETIKGKPVDIVLDMGSYRWTIDGAEVNAADLKDIDLEVTIGTDTVPSALVSSIAEGKPATQLSLTHNGEFGFRADLTLNLGSEHSGSYGNLYYYDSSGKLVFRNAGQIGADGSTTLSFSHASDYVAVIDKIMHTAGGADKGSGDSSDKGNTGGLDKETTGGADSGAKTEIDNGTKAEPDSSANGEIAGTGTGDKEELPSSPGGDVDMDNPEKDKVRLKEQEEEELEERGEQDTQGKEREDLTASVKKNTGSITTDSGSASAATTSSSSFKSPKTGE